MNILILCAAGNGERLKLKTPKALVPINGQPLFIRALRNVDCPEINQLLILAPSKYRQRFETAIKRLLPAKTNRKIMAVIPGGQERQHSIHQGLKYLAEKQIDPADIVLIHNAANPFATRADIQKLLGAIKKNQAAGLAVPTNDTLREVNARMKPVKKLDRRKIWRMQTPQGASFKIIYQAYQKASQDRFLGTDDLELIERLKYPIQIIESNAFNFKITYPEDLKIATALLRRKNN